MQLYLKSLKDYFLSLPSRNLQLAGCHQEGAGMAARLSPGAAEFPPNPQGRNHTGQAAAEMRFSLLISKEVLEPTVPS